MELGAIVGIAGVAGAVALYVIRAELRGDVTRLDGRIDTHEKGCERRQQTLDERHTAINANLAEIRGGQHEMNDKLDRLIERRNQPRD